MNTLIIDPYILEILKTNGWYKGRMFDTLFWITQLSKEGYRCFEYAQEILQELGGIEVNVGNTNGYKGAMFDFNPYSAASGEYDRIEIFQNVVKENLFPIGSMCDAIVYVGNKNNIYFGDWKSLFWHGKNLEDYLNRLFDVNRLPVRLI